MKVWHLEVDTPRKPERVSPGEAVELVCGTWPIAPGQTVYASVWVESATGPQNEFVRRARWLHNRGPNSYFSIPLGRFERGARVRYRVFAEDSEGKTVSAPEREFRVGPKIHLALLWHQHQPIYRDPESTRSRGSYLEPWVRLHALRDYYAMAAMVVPHKNLRLSINLTPALLVQIDDYLSGATDRAFELGMMPAEKLSSDERREIVATFFRAHPQHQICVHRRYRELYEMRSRGEPFRDRDITDLQMWFSLAWCGPELRDGSVSLPGGRSASVKRLLGKGRGFGREDFAELAELEWEILRQVVPIHAELQRAGRIEVTTTPFYHPILPLLVDSDRATLDRTGAALPRRFSHPEDADAQVRLAVLDYARRFGIEPRGMWPAEGAVSAEVVPLFARHGVRWIATDRGVLERSGRFGYRVQDADVSARPYRAEQDGLELAVFFRDTELSDAIGFEYQHQEDADHAAYDFVTRIKERFANRVRGDDDRVVTVALDGENPWGGYADDGRPFLHALYSLLAHDDEIETVTFSDFLGGSTGGRAHPIDSLERVDSLFTGSWADTPGSAPGVDLGPWIGEPEDNAAWELLGATRDALTNAGHTPESTPKAFDALYAAEGSDWFWWFGSGREADGDDTYDRLFRAYLRTALRRAGLAPGPELDRAIVPGFRAFQFDHELQRLDPGARLAVRVDCPGRIEWWLDGGPRKLTALVPAGGVMAGHARHQALLGPFGGDAKALEFVVLCENPDCKHESVACSGEVQRVEIG
jgi:alpha-amylase/alpha-mannosidase (GH57 family)